MIRPAFVVGGLYTEANGVARIMRDLAAALGRAGFPVTVYGAECHGRESIGHIFEPPSRWVSAPGWWLGGLSWSPRLKDILRERLHESDVVHNHSVWMLPNSYSSRIARTTGKPVIITAHGTLEPWAIRHSRWKKRAAGLAFQDRDLQEADCMHVNSHSELEGIRSYGIKSPAAVIPNGIDLEEFENLPDASVFREGFPAMADRRIALFMARLHAKKGLEHLLRAWGALQGELADWHLVVAGPDCGFERPARQLVDDLGLEGAVTFTGQLQGRMRLAALSSADVFLHPSFSEGFSMSILEALGCRLPVLLTPGCNFPESVESGAAIQVEPTVSGTIGGLRQILELGDRELLNMGDSGRRLVEQRFTWDRVAGSLIEVYRWLCGSGPRPNSVVE